MKFVDIYFDFKSRYEDYIVFYKVGNFYNVLGKDSLIMHELMNYQIGDHCGTPKVGFPLVSLERVIKTLCKNKINYLVLEKQEGIVKIAQKRKHKENNYVCFGTSVSDIYDKKRKVEEIKEKLISKINDVDFDEIIEKVREIL